MSIFSFLRGKSVICPFCLTDNRYSNKIEKCVKCGFELPVQYVNNYQQALPFFVQLVGWSGAGKTTYLQSLTLMLKKMDRFWGNNYVCSPLTESTRQFMRNVKIYEAEGEMPSPSQIRLHDAYILLLQGMERWGGRILVTRDVAGENFSSLNFPLEFMPYLVQSPVNLMMISIPDIVKEKDRSVFDLMDSYIDTLAQHKRDYKNANLKLVIVLSKADKLKNQLPDDLRNYLEEDPFSMLVKKNMFVDSEFMNAYMEKLYFKSSRTKEWFSQTQEGGQMLINKTVRENIQLYFTLISSTGVDPGPEGKMFVNLNPLRVMDPYFLALDFYSKNSNSELAETDKQGFDTAKAYPRAKTTARKLKVFLCHASQDKPIVHELYQKFIAEGWIEPWLDAKKLLPGQDWQMEIKNAVEKADNVIIFLSNTSINKDGFIQKELRLAKDIALEKSEGSVFLIPLRLDECEVPRSLQIYQWANYFGEEQKETYSKLLESLKLRLENILRKEINTKQSGESEGGHHGA